ENVIGGAGSDTLVGDTLANILVGGGGNDTLVGGDGNDVMIGGTGADGMIGEGGGDLMVASRTAFDGNITALLSIMAEWSSARDYATRLANITGTGSGLTFTSRLNGSNFLISTGTAATVFDDAVADKVEGD